MLLAAPIYFKRLMGIKEASYGVCHPFAQKKKNPALSGLLDVMLYELDMQDPQRNDWVFLRLYIYLGVVKRRGEGQRGGDKCCLFERETEREERG